MKIFTNTKYIERRSSVGKWASVLGLGVLALGFVLSLRDPTLIFVSFGTLILGFILSNVGIFYANRYVSANRPDAVLAQSLKGFDKRFALYQFLLPVSQVLCEPGGLTVFVLKPQEGRILFESGKWHHKQGWSRLMRWVGQESLGKPDQEAEREAQELRDWLQKNVPDLEVPVRGVVVFTHPKAELMLDEPPVSAMSPKQLKGWLRKAGKLPPLPKETLVQLTQLLNNTAQVDEHPVDE